MYIYTGMNLATISIPYWGQCARREDSCAHLLIVSSFVCFTTMWDTCISGAVS